MTDASETVPAAGPEAAPPAAGTMECPFCAEQISAKAKKCRYCNEVLDPALRKAEEALRQAQSTPHVYMNAGGGGGGAVAAGAPALRHWGHFWHLVLSVITAGLWIPVWIILYLARNRNVFY